jgi:hypothetical protein
MLMRRSLSWVVVIMFLSGFSVFGQNNAIDPFTIPSARFAALGGNHVAVGDSFHSMFTNPASFIDIEEQFSAGELTISTFGPVFELLDLISSTAGTMNIDFSSVVTQRGFSSGFDIAGPLSLGWVGNGFGLGIFNRIKTDVAVTGSTIKPKLGIDILFISGYSHRFMDQGIHLLDGGFLGKGFFRGALDLETPIFDALTLLDNPLEKPFNTYFGIGLDLGLRYTLRNNLTFALVCFDIFSPVLRTPYLSFVDLERQLDLDDDLRFRVVTRRLEFGMKYTISNPTLDMYISGLTIMASYRNILDVFSLISRNPLLNFGIGIELEMLDVLTFRFGLAETLPAFGIGICLSFLTLDMAMYGRELGIDPGRNSTYGLSLGILFRY